MVRRTPLLKWVKAPPELTQKLGTPKWGAAARGDAAHVALLAIGAREKFRPKWWALL